MNRLCACLDFAIANVCIAAFNVMLLLVLQVMRLNGYHFHGSHAWFFIGASLEAAIMLAFAIRACLAKNDELQK